MKARQDQFQRDLAALRADPKMTNPQKQTKYNAMVQAMSKDLMAVLTPTQRAGEMKRQQVNAQFQKDVAALRADKSMTVAQKKARYLTLVQAADAQTLATLTASQRSVALKRHQTQSEALEVANELQKSQSPAQVKQIQAISIAARTQMQAVIADKTLSPQVKTARIKEMTSKEEGQISALLTPSQRVKFTRWQQLMTATPGTIKSGIWNTNAARLWRAAFVVLLELEGFVEPAQEVQQLPDLVGQGRMELEALPRAGMVEAQGMGVQGLAVEPAKEGIQSLQRRPAKQVRADFTQAAVGGIADDRVAGEGAVDPDLVGPSCLQDRFGPTELRQMFQEAQLGDRLTRTRRQIARPHPPLLHDGHALAVAGVPADRRINDGVLKGEAAPKEGVVLANGGPLLYLLGKALVRRVVFGDDQKAGGVFVQSVYDTGAHSATDA